ncbi:cupin domain-containing protein [Acuticoccus sediminis]|uniref:cupin domain-containing protein n=1 Tax=Acuticoccus sediminis TaxID=2184697 RepID=UPI001CFCF415|nr:cupin domain-containing protein [Acuticoccus sediminis]
MRNIAAIAALAGWLIALAGSAPADAHDLSAQAPEAGASRVNLVFDHELPNVPGKSLRAVLVEYGPGGSSPAHTHAPSAFIFATVLEGAMKSQINDGDARVYQAGESFVEMPGDHHPISANASETEPMKLLAVFVVDTDDEVLTTPDPQ